MKILFLKNIINIVELKELKVNNKITFNPNDTNIDIVINDTTIYFYNYEDYSIEYDHWMKDTNLAFIIETLESTLSELSSMNF